MRLTHLCITLGSLAYLKQSDVVNFVQALKIDASTHTSGQDIYEFSPSGDSNVQEESMLDEDSKTSNSGKAEAKVKAKVGSKSRAEWEHYLNDLREERERRAKQKKNPGHAKGRTLTQRTNQGETINVHMIPFSRTDMGFKKTIDEYYVGANQMTQHGQVNIALTAVVDELIRHPERRFTFAEMKYLQMWYVRQDQKTKDQLKTLIQNGQFEVASGSWSSFDEACPSFEDMINNLMIGHNFLMREFQYTPKVAWNIEAAGHSASAARIFSQLGY